MERDPGLRPSASLYHLIRPAAAILIKMPTALTRSCIQNAPDTSTMAKWPAKDRNTPRQQIFSECCPQPLAGHAQRDLRNGQSRGMNFTVTTASARKCAN